MSGDSEVTIGFKTFLRPEKLRRCLEHIKKLSLQPSEVIISDDSPRKGLNERIYSEFRDCMPLRVLDLEPDAGLAVGRNRILEETATDFLLIIDDDQYVPPDLLRLKNVLESEPSLGGIAAAWMENGDRKMIAGDIRILNNWVIIDTFDSKRAKHTAGISYFLYDFIPNGTLFRTEALREYRWDETYVIDGEHEDFYLGHKMQTDWEFAITPDIWIEHDPGPGYFAEYYSDHRMNEDKRSKSREYFVDKWGVKGYLFRGYHYKEHRNLMDRLAARTLYKLPPRFQWEIKKRGLLKWVKFILGDRDRGIQGVGRK